MAGIQEQEGKGNEKEFKGGRAQITEIGLYPERCQARERTGSIMGCSRPPIEGCLISEGRMKEVSLQQALASEMMAKICSHLLA